MMGLTRCHLAWLLLLAGRATEAAMHAERAVAELHDNPEPWSATAVSVDIGAGALACLSLWGRRRFPVGVAVA